MYARSVQYDEYLPMPVLEALIESPLMQQLKSLSLIQGAVNAAGAAFLRRHRSRYPKVKLVLSV